MQALLDWVVVAVAVGVALGAVAVAQRALRRWSKDHWTPARAVADRCGRPAYFVAALVGVIASVRPEMVPEAVRQPVEVLLDLMLIAAVTWLLVRTLHVVTKALEGDAAEDHGVASTKARQIRTQMMLLRRVITALGLTVGGAVMLFQFDAVQTFATAALASAGVIGIIAGFAAREALGNLLAGFQVAFSELVSVDDVVEVEGEWGQIEEVTLQYVVVRIWDERRLIIPVGYFIQTPFRNWTSRDDRIIGTVFLYMDWRVPIEELRRELDTLLHGHPLWDGQVGAILLTDVTQEGLVEVRATLSAADGFAAWDLRCEVRERLVAYVRENYPDSLPRQRVRLDAASSAHGGTPEDRAADEHPEADVRPDETEPDEARDDVRPASGRSLSRRRRSGGPASGQSASGQSASGGPASG